MAPKSKSIFRQPGTQHFQLVHRSQRDPLIHDPEASQHVLKPFIRENDRKGKTRAELEELLNPSDLAHDQARENIGEASLYGIYYDDTEYDYMQHLRIAGMHEDGVESTLIEAPAIWQAKPKGKERVPVTLRDLPAEALPSATELPRDYESQQAIQSSISGFQPDMDPHLRQALEALEDDAFVDDRIEDDFFAELVQDGEAVPEEREHYDFAEEGIEDDVARIDEEDEEEGQLNENAGWEARFAAFKRKKEREALKAGLSDNDDNEEGASEGADTVGRMPAFSVIGGKKRRRGGSDASGYSMTSSSMFRTDGLRLLDDRFEQFEKEYDETDEEIPDDSDSDSDSAPELITSREDFEALMDDFLENYEVHGGKMKPSLEGVGAEKLQQLRLAMGRDGRVRESTSDESSDNDEEAIYAMLEKEDKSDRWDVETVLTTYTNLENHPRLIRARESKPVPKIALDPRTGLPTIAVESVNKRHERPPDEDGAPREVRQTVTRARDESKADRKARKTAVKQEKQTRRAEKKTTKQQFSAAIRLQTKVVAARDAKTRKL
ncbi:LTV-domain-containing protein [Vararia minispora EC-137]|uniref:LTV-domain-containing protein n=1 Tax=Vararia minispora EC-137 TaxID=1314806 RepID=A0ACB8QA30_9AGAM|nr:LTV-domain-containing protein [Vararia minispora EC-137]